MRKIRLDSDQFDLKGQIRFSVFSGGVDQEPDPGPIFPGFATMDRTHLVLFLPWILLQGYDYAIGFRAPGQPAQQPGQDDIDIDLPVSPGSDIRYQTEKN